MSKWLLRAKPTGVMPQMRLFCFAYAGGSAMLYRPWQSGIDPRIEVVALQLPGRGSRMGEPPMTDINALVRELAQQITPLTDLPFAFFGHSLGGLLAFEVARYCLLHHLPLPQHLFASGCNAPQKRNPSENLHLLSDDDLIAKLQTFNGTPPDVLAHRELMELVLPTIRADFSLVETWQYRPMPLLNLPITVLAGKRDDRSSPEQAEAWQLETQGPSRVVWFEGDHFFIHGENDAVLAHVQATLLG
jgi:medium-chain acyl-[acyl-carrier-protein] hydrolase